MNKIEVKDFSLKYTIESGQFFSFYFNQEFYWIVHKNIVFKVKQEDNFLFFSGISQEDFIDFFGLDEDLKVLTCEFDDEYLLLALEKYWGLRIIREDLWQCMIGFVCSSASNIAKIKKNMFFLSEFFGEQIEFEGKKFYTFPKPGKIDNLERIKDAKTGFRAKYIYEINEFVSNNPEFLEKIQTSNYKDAKKLLMNLPGVGSKVADCICLYGLGHKEAFPIDTWIKQVIEEIYLKKPSTIKEIEEFIQSYFKGNLGLAQQYLFHYIRNK